MKDSTAERDAARTALASRAAPCGDRDQDRRAARLAPFLFCVLLAGCAGEGPLIFGEAGKYQYHNCEQLVTWAKAQSKREQELKALIEKAEQGAAGALVGAIAYRSDYIAVGEDLRVIEATARNKNCRTPSTWMSNSVIQ
jgi:hypothetical protein